MIGNTEDGLKHMWKFRRAGGFDQVRLEGAADLLALDQLDQKLWVALSCPTRGLEMDNRTLDLIDTDHDGRIRVPEIIEAVRWACRHLKQPDDLVKGAAALPLAAIQDGTAEGRQMLASARQILANLGKKDATEITVSDTADTARIMAQSGFNGDGVVNVEVADDPALRALIQDIIACVGSETDRSGKPGVTQARADQFSAEAQAYSDWWKKAEADAAILPLGPATPAAVAAARAVRGKVDDYFARCRLAAFDSRAAAALNREEKEYLALAAKDLTIDAAEIAGFPLARVEAGRPLPLAEGLNPAWATAMARFRAEVVKPLLGDKAALREDEWTALTARLSPHEAWLGSKAGAAVEKLGLPRVREILGGTVRDGLNQLIARDKALEPEFAAIAAVDRLTRYYRDLFTLLNNFVSFRDFYGRKQKATFQAGTLYLDQRSCDLCVRIEDIAKHSALAGQSRMYLAYCDLTRRGSSEKMTVAAAFTAGESDYLMVGRNGIFYDRQGRDWDATIVKLVEHPISIRQAFWSPYKRFIKLVEDQIEKLASAREKAVQDAAAAKVGAAGTAVAAAPSAAPSGKPAFDVAKFAGIFAAIGLAIGAIGGALGAMLTAFSRLVWWQMPLALLGIMLLISGPSVVIAWLKLRQRNLAPLLDACGWAVNARARINIPFGGSLTRVAQIPAGSQRDLADPFAEDTSGRRRLIALLVAAAVLWGLWHFGVLDRWAAAWFGCRAR